MVTGFLLLGVKVLLFFLAGVFGEARETPRGDETPLGPKGDPPGGRLIDRDGREVGIGGFGGPFGVGEL